MQQIYDVKNKYNSIENEWNVYEWQFNEKLIHVLRIHFEAVYHFPRDSGSSLSTQLSIKKICPLYLCSFVYKCVCVCVFRRSFPFVHQQFFISLFKFGVCTISLGF